MAELHPNAQAVLGGFKAFAEGDMVAMKELFADDAVWHVGGRNDWTGDYQGVDAILRFFGEISAEATFDQDLHAVLADDEHVVVLVNNTATRGDKTLDGQTVFIFHVSNGKSSEVWSAALDPYAADEFWA
jgi:hypothetical protein